uniref:Ras and Rab interactor 1 n=1 Tax=Chelydra serpentina TaxID=8475 RepID=A0A8C3SJK3_CHESE
CPSPSSRLCRTRNWRPFPTWGSVSDTTHPALPPGLLPQPPTPPPQARGVGVHGPPRLLPSAAPGPPLRSMSDAVLAVLAPEKQLARAVEGLARDRSTRLGASVQDFLTLVRGGGVEWRSSHELLSPIRTFLTHTKAQLLQSPALELPSPTLLPDHRLDAVLEWALHRCVLKPLKAVLASRLRRLRVADGSLGQLRENLQMVRERGPSAFPARAPLPSPPDTQRARRKLLQLLRAYSPGTQVTLLLQACKGVYRAMGAAPDGSYGADEFLPVLSFILAQCDLPQLLMEAEYMMELMEPSQLLGEGGYYLTTLQASLALLGRFHEEEPRELCPNFQRALSWRHQPPSERPPGSPCQVRGEVLGGESLMGTPCYPPSPCPLSTPPCPLPTPYPLPYPSPLLAQPAPITTGTCSVPIPHVTPSLPLHLPQCPLSPCPHPPPPPPAHAHSVPDLLCLPGATA